MSVVLKRTVGDSDDVSITCAEVIFRGKVILYRKWMVFISLLIDLIGQLNCHVIGCETFNR